MNFLKENATFLLEIILAFGAVALMIFLLNPLNIWMPNEMVMMISVGLLIILSLFAHFMWKEQSGDEREQLHRYIVNRYAYLVGCAILTIAVVWESFQHTLDPWIVVALGGMILAKVVGSFITRWKY